MSDMVERVARAICLKLSGPELDECENAARAAIEAMREPTRAMFLAGRELAHSGDEDELMDRDSVKERWRVMIDAALSERT